MAKIESIVNTFVSMMENLANLIVPLIPGQKRMLLLANKSGVAFYFVVSVIVFYVGTFVIFPFNHRIEMNDPTIDSNASTPISTWILSFCMGNMMLNYLRAIFNPPFYDAGQLKVPTAEGGKNWGYCVPCQQYVPPRAHHCSVCNQCVLKRESHCFFLGNCVGHINQGFFVVFLFYTALSSLFALLHLGMYFHHVIGPIVSLRMHHYLVPVATYRCFMGYFTVTDYLMLLLFYNMLMIGLGCSFLFFQQISLILQGQTSYEAAKKVNLYDSGAHLNLQDVFGRYWWVRFIIPIKFSQPVDGIKWSRVKDIKRY
nr:palmitoyltransferase ZDHHC22-like [Lytechinus pictus]